MVVRQGARLAGVGNRDRPDRRGARVRALESLLFETSGLDPLTFVLASLVLGAAAIVASYLPARRAASVAPVVALGR